MTLMCLLDATDFFKTGQYTVGTTYEGGAA